MAINTNTTSIAIMKAIYNNTEQLLNKVDVIQNGVTSTVWSRGTVLLDTNDARSHYWRIENTPNWYYGNCLVNQNAAAWNQIDCTNFRYCTVRINGNIDSTPSGATANHSWMRIGFTQYADLAIQSVNEVPLVHKWNSTAEGNIGSNTEGLAYDKWYDLTIDISELTGVQTLNVFVGGSSNNSGTMYCSRITVHN